MEVIENATGSGSARIHHRVLNQVMETLWLPGDLGDDEKINKINAAMTILHEIKPQDALEGMLTIQMLAAHNAAMECLRRTMIDGQSFEGRDINLKHAARFLSIYSRQLEALGKHRGKGQQKVTVEYVNVESGGQAVVGNVEINKGKKTENKKNQSSPPEIPDMPSEVFDLAAASLKRKKSKVTKKIG